MMVWVLVTYLANGSPKIELAFTTQTACEHMIASLSDPAHRSNNEKAPNGFQCIRVPMQDD